MVIRHLYVFRKSNRMNIYTLIVHRITGLIFLAILLSENTEAQISCPPHLPLTLEGNTSYCVGNSGSNLSVAENYAGYEWLPTAQTGQSAVLPSGSYQVVVTHYTGCTDTLDFVVDVVSAPAQPTIDVNGPTEFCEGESVVLSVANTYLYYEWSTGSVGQTITVAESGIYDVSVANLIGCNSPVNSVQITVNPLPTAAFSPGLDLFDVQFNNYSQNATDYEWNFGDGTTSMDFEPTHTFTIGGTVAMYLVATNSCGNDTSFLDLTSVNVEEMDEAFSISAFPNPSNGLLQLSLGIKTASECNFVVYDGSGRMLQTFKRSFPAGRNQLPMDLTHLHSGLYFLTIEHETKQAHVQLIIE